MNHLPVFVRCWKNGYKDPSYNINIEAAGGFLDNFWPSKNEIKVFFYGWDEDLENLYDEIIKVANELGKYSIKFVLCDFADTSDIRISFTDPEPMVCIGCSAQSYNKKSTLNLYGFDKQYENDKHFCESDYFKYTVLHMFGHALGMDDEWRSWDIPWMKQAIYEHCDNLRIDRDIVNHSLFGSVKKRDEEINVAMCFGGPSMESARTSYDKKSVMNCNFPSYFSKPDMFVREYITEPSMGDKIFLSLAYGKVKPREFMRRYCQYQRSGDMKILTEQDKAYINETIQRITNQG